jgi:V8-like Glu-specific endopeptidase
MLRTFLLVTSTAAAFAFPAERATAQAQPVGNQKGPTTADANGRDFIDGKGRRWIATGKVVFKELNVADTEVRRTDNRPVLPPIISVQELAEKLRPRRLVGEYEYLLEHPDLDLAQKILAGGKVPLSNSFRPAEVVGPPFIVGSDDRTRVTAPRFFPGSPNAYLTQTCTATLIGPSTALSAAHCFYQNGWIMSRSITFGADTVAPTAPFGSYLADSLTMPGAWNNTEWDWDFAVLEFSPTRSPGLTTGWFGTEQDSSGTQTIVGYPSDKPVPSSWIKSGTYTASPGSRYEHNIDIISGDSGACAYNANTRCTGIQSTQWRNSTRIWNEVRRWDLTTFSFFDAYGNWPPPP